ncbi:MAG: transketolase [Cyanobacteria bacterium DS3.002]|nr:transketolase [Cyanobacteria bacterium DS3.002]MBA4049650.1 transketolase [Cyanobacteria bacterium DS2.008]MBA4075396.1 transketolase [Cyanobacteria bacterium PR.023]
MTTTKIAFDARILRKTILRMSHIGKTAHIACAFSLVEILAVLYRDFVSYPKNDPENSHRDFLILSKGHGVMAQYACLKELGWLSEDEILNYFADGSLLKGLSDSRVYGLEVTSGSLGHGFSVGVGMALGAKLRKTEQKTYVIVGDGEINEGAIWEGALFAAHHELHKFMVIVDQNGYQAMGSTDEILKLDDLQRKFESFGFESITVDGHDEAALRDTIARLELSSTTKPKAVIAKTIKGKGVPFMENDNLWHYTRLSPEAYKLAVAAVDGAVK